MVKTLHEIGGRRAVAVAIFGLCSWGSLYFDFLRFLRRWRIESIPRPLTTVILLSILGTVCGALVALVVFGDRRRVIWGGFHGTVASLCGTALYFYYHYVLADTRMYLGWSTLTSSAREAPEGNLYTGWYAIAGAVMGLVYGILQAQLHDSDKRVRVTMTLLYGLAGALAWVIVPSGIWVS